MRLLYHRASRLCNNSYPVSLVAIALLHKFEAKILFSNRIDNYLYYHYYSSNHLSGHGSETGESDRYGHGLMQEAYFHMER